MRRNDGTLALRYGCAVLSVAAAIAIRLLLEPVLGRGLPFALTFLAILFTARAGGFGPALVAVLLGGLASDYYLLEPRGVFSLAGADERAGLAVYLAAGLGTALLARSTEAARRSAEAQATELARKAAIIDLTHDAIFVWDWGGAITFWNRGAERLYGIPPAKALGRVSHELLHTATAGGPGAMLKALEREGSWEGELEHTLGDGRVIIVETRMVLIREEERAYVIEANRDITPRRGVEQALREKEIAFNAADRRLAEIVHGMTEACFAVDKEWRFTFVNDSGLRVLRHSREEMIGRSIWEVFHQLKGTPMEGNYRRAMKERVPLAFEAFSPVAERWVDIRLFPTGEGLAAFLLDINARKKAELAGVLLAAIVESSMDAIVGKDVNGIVNSWNSGAERMFGYSASEMVGTSITRIIPPDRREEEERTLASIRRGARVDHFETVRVRKDGALIDVSITVSPIKDSNGAIIGASKVARDITEWKRVQAEISKLNAELEDRVIERTAQLDAANKELEAFSYSVSHDLRAPLRAVDGFSQAVLEDYGPQLPEKAQFYLRTIRRSAQQMGALIDDLLAFSRLSRAPLKTEAVDPVKLVEGILADTAHDIEGRNVDFHIGKMPACQGDPALLRQVWINLISNAVKYTRGREEALVDIGCEQRAEGRAFFVRDNGTGFDMRYAHKLFGVFQRLHRAEDYEGTGVGLAIVQRIVHRHGGRVWADALPDRGSTFYFTLNEEAKP